MSHILFDKKRFFFPHVAVLCMLFVCVTGCAISPLRDARNAFYDNQPQEAIKVLSDAKQLSKRDKLLFLMEKGLIFHDTGQYEESIREFLEASKLMEQQDVISISQQTASLVTTDWITEYKGEHSERLWVHTYLMMNFLVTQKYESALVEAKKALKILEKHPKPLSGDYFTRALIALCHETIGEINGAYVEYKKLAEQMSDPSAVAPQLYQIGRRLGFTDEAEHYLKFIPKTVLSRMNKGPSAELVLFVGLGNGPVKVPENIVIPPSIRFSFPRYESHPVPFADIMVLDSARRRLPVSVAVATNIGAVASDVLQDRAKQVIAKETARAAIKEAVARAVERKNEEIVGVLLRAALFLLEEPDTRCWQTLPASLKLLRVPVANNAHDLNVIIRSDGLEDNIALPPLRISPGQKIFHSLRVTD